MSRLNNANTKRCYNWRDSKNTSICHKCDPDTYPTGKPISENDLLGGNDKMIGYIGIIDALTINEERKLKHEVQTLRQEVTALIKCKNRSKN